MTIWHHRRFWIFKCNSPISLSHLLDVVQEEVVVRELGRAGLALVDPLRRLAPMNPEDVVVQDCL